MMFSATCSCQCKQAFTNRLGAGHCWSLLRDISMVGFSFRSCDKYGLGVITPHEFRSGIEKRLGYPMSERQWEQVKCDVGQDSDGLIPYNKFLQMFDVPLVSILLYHYHTCITVIPSAFSILVSLSSNCQQLYIVQLGEELGEES